MIGRDDPGSVGFALEPDPATTHRLESAEVRLRKSRRRGPIMAKVDVETVAAIMGGRDLGHGR
jgi:hypothetical protein